MMFDRLNWASLAWFGLHCTPDRSMAPSSFRRLLCNPWLDKLRGLSDRVITGWWFQPLWKIFVNWDNYSQYMEKSVPNHQPDHCHVLCLSKYCSCKWVCCRGTPTCHQFWKYYETPAKDKYKVRCVHRWFRSYLIIFASFSAAVGM